MTLSELIVYGTASAALGVYLVDALRVPHWCGNRVWRWRRSCDACVSRLARRFDGDLPNLKVKEGRHGQV